MKKYNYYKLDTGFFNAPVKLCFGVSAFQEVLHDAGLRIKEMPLNDGIAETHFIDDDPKNSLIIVIFDLNDCNVDEEEQYLLGVIAHESVHVVERVFQYVGDADEAGEETRAYLTEHIFKQIYKGVKDEFGKRNRKAIKLLSKIKPGLDIQVDINSDGSTGSNNNPEPKTVPSGIKNSYRKNIR